jgi:hypothetical protein
MISTKKSQKMMFLYYYSHKKKITHNQAAKSQIY